MSNEPMALIDRAYEVRYIIMRLAIKTPQGFLLLRRSQTVQRSKGKWEFPGGKMEEGNFAGDLLREITEETKIALNSTQAVKLQLVDTQIKPLLDLSGKRVTVVNLTHYSLIEIQTEINVSLSPEHDDFCFVYSLQELDDLELKEGTAEVFEKIWKKQESAM